MCKKTRVKLLTISPYSVLPHYVDIYICGHTHTYVHARTHAHMQGENVPVKFFYYYNEERGQQKELPGLIF